MAKSICGPFKNHISLALALLKGIPDKQIEEFEMQLKLKLACALALCISAVPALAAVPSFVQVGKKVFYEMNSVSGVVTSIDNGFPIFDAGSVTIHADNGQDINIPSDKYDWLLRAEGCNQQKVCVGDTAYVERIDNLGNFDDTYKNLRTIICLHF